MSAKHKGASYVQRHHDASLRDTKKQSKRPFAILLSSILAVFTFFLVFAPVVTTQVNPAAQQGTQANAFFEIFCSADIGNGMDNKRTLSTTLRSFPNPDAKNRKWTLQEAYGEGIRLVNFQGVGEGSDWAIPKPVDELPKEVREISGFDDAVEHFEGVRNASDCFFGGWSANISNWTFNTANFISGITQTVVVYAFDTGVICAEPGQGGACIDLLGVIGGSNNADDTGLIGILTNSIYMPLMVIMVAIGGVTVMYRGIVKRQLRDALGKALWVVGSVVLGVIILAFPATVSQAPMVVSNSIASCVIGAFNGDNCLTESSSGSGVEDTPGASTSANVCSSYASGLNTSDQMSMTINSLTCAIWRSFVLEPFSNASFGLSFDELDTRSDSNPELKTLISDAGFSNTDFCINLSSKGSVNDNVGLSTRMNMNNGKQVCNIAAYQMFLTHDTTKGSSNDSGMAPDAGDQDNRWYKLAVLLSQDEGLWNEWTVGWASGFQKLMLAFLSVLTSLLGAVVLIIIAFYAMVFKLGAVILTALAPLFLLFMIEPTRGRKMAAGWFGQLLSNIMKYMASVLFLLIAIVLFGAVLGNAGSNMIANVIFMMILTGALLMYRREIVDLIGRVDMGTQVLSNKIGERMKGQAKLAGSVATGAIGAKMAGGTIMAGARDTFKRDMARGAGREAFGDFLGRGTQGVARQYNRQKVAETQKLRTDASKASNESKEAHSSLETVTQQYDKEVANLQTFDDTRSKEAVELKFLDEEAKTDQGLREETQAEIGELSPEFAQAMALLDEIKNLELQAKIAIEMGDIETARGITSNIADLSTQQREIMDGISVSDAKMLHEEYNEALREKREAAGISYNDQDRARHQNLIVRDASADMRRGEITAKLDDLSERGKALQIEAEEKNARATLYENDLRERMPGNEISGQKRRKLDKTADKEAADAVENIAGLEQRFDKHKNLQAWESEVYPVTGGTPDAAPDMPDVVDRESEPLPEPSRFERKIDEVLPDASQRTMPDLDDGIDAPNDDATRMPFNQSGQSSFEVDTEKFEPRDLPRSTPVEQETAEGFNTGAATSLPSGFTESIPVDPTEKTSPAPQQKPQQPKPQPQKEPRRTQRQSQPPQQNAGGFDTDAASSMPSGFFNSEPVDTSNVDTPSPTANNDLASGLPSSFFGADGVVDTSGSDQQQPPPRRPRRAAPPNTQRPRRPGSGGIPRNRPPNPPKGD